MTARISLQTDQDTNLQLSSDEIVVNNLIANNYEELDNKPLIDGTTLIGDKSLEDLGITPDRIGISRITNQELMELLT